MTTHFYTVDGNERQNAIQNLGFRDEGIQCYVVQSPPAGQAPFYRAYHTQTGGHFYTMSIEEVDRATNGNDWVAEGIACYIYPQQLGGTVPLYRAYLRQSNDHFYTTSKPEHDNAVNGGFNDEGIAGYVFPSQAGGTVPLYRLFRTTHFYTVDGNERQNAIQNLGFRDEGIACYVQPSPVSGPAPLFRAYHTRTGGHFYTMSIEEVDRATNGNDWVAEGIACYIYPQQLGGTVPLYRAYLRQSNDHFYTTSKPEHDIAVNGGCSDEGIAGYVFPSQAGGTVPLYRLYGPHAPVPLGPMQADTGDEHVGTGEWMHSGASMSSTGLISGHTRIWCTILLKGFHGSVFPVLLDGDQKVIWPPNPEVAKHQYGVDGVWIGTHDRTEYWANQADASVIGEAKSLALIQFYDPKKMLLADLDIVGKAITVIVSAIKAL